MKAKHGTRVHSRYHLVWNFKRKAFHATRATGCWLNHTIGNAKKPVNEPQLRFQMHREKLEFGTGYDALVVEVRSVLLEVFDERVGILQ